MIDKYAHIGVTRALRRKRRINCREAARLLYQARQLGKAAEFIWRHRTDAEPDEIVNHEVIDTLAGQRPQAEGALPPNVL